MEDWRSALPDRLAGAAERHGVPGAAIAVGHGDDLVEAAHGVLDAASGRSNRSTTRSCPGRTPPRVP